MIYNTYSIEQPDDIVGVIYQKILKFIDNPLLPQTDDYNFAKPKKVKEIARTYNELLDLNNKNYLEDFNIEKILLEEEHEMLESPSRIDEGYEALKKRGMMRINDPRKRKEL